MNIASASSPETRTGRRQGHPHLAAVVWAGLAAVLVMMVLSVVTSPGSGPTAQVLWDAPQGPARSAAAERWRAMEGLAAARCEAPTWWRDSTPARAYQIRLPPRLMADGANVPWALSVEDAIASRAVFVVGGLCGDVSVQGRLEPFGRRSVPSPFPNRVLSGAGEGETVVLILQDAKSFRPWLRLRSEPALQRQATAAWMLITTLAAALVVCGFVVSSFQHAVNRGSVLSFLLFVAAILVWLLHNYSVGSLLLPGWPWSAWFDALHGTVVALVVGGVGVATVGFLAPARRLRLTLQGLVLAASVVFAASNHWQAGYAVASALLLAAAAVTLGLAVRALQRGRTAMRLFLLGLVASISGGAVHALSVVAGGEHIGPASAFAFSFGALLHVLAWMGAVLIGERDRRRRQREQMWFSANHDALTGLLNRRRLTELVQAFLISPTRPTAALLFIDLDRFKLVNDSLGHAAGDALLLDVSARLQACLKTWQAEHPGWRAHASRFNADEFVLWLEAAAGSAPQAGPPQASLAGLETLARQLIEQVQHPINLRGFPITVAAAVGMRLIPAAERFDALPGSDLHADAPADVRPNGPAGARAERDDGAVGLVIGDADAALREARATPAGELRWRLFEPAMRAALQTRLQLESEIHEGLRAGQFQLHYQPIVRLPGGEHAGMEALLRWHHPRRGLVPPGLFIPVAEETGSIVPLGRWIVDQACRDIADLQRRGLWRSGWTVSVNVSARQLDDPELLTRLDRAMREHGVQAQDLRVELTESSVIGRQEQARPFFEALQARGIELSMDDFGTGYSSLSTLGSLPFNVLKLDKSFLDALVHDRTQQALVQAVLSLAAQLDLRVIAEGVESPEQARWLSAHACGYAQGFLYSRPLHAGSLEAWLQSHAEGTDAPRV